MAKHRAPLLDPRCDQGVVHLPGRWHPDGRTPCGARFLKLEKGHWVTAVPTAIMPQLVTCEACYATEDVKHPQDYEYGRHTGPLPDLWDLPVIAATPAGVLPDRLTPAGLWNSGRTDLSQVLYGDDGLHHVITPHGELWWK